MRRRLVASLLLLAVLVSGHGSRVVPNPLPPAQARFPLSAIALDAASPLALSQARNARYMMSLNSSRLTCLFTASANLTGTWEAPTCEPCKFWRAIPAENPALTALKLPTTPP
jgi:hypothetical protein